MTDENLEALVVEDDPLWQREFSSLLKPLRVLVTDSVETGLEVLAREGIRTVVTDWDLGSGKDENVRFTEPIIRNALEKNIGLIVLATSANLAKDKRLSDFLKSLGDNNLNKITVTGKRGAYDLLTKLKASS